MFGEEGLASDISFLEVEGNALNDAVGGWFGTFFWVIGAISLFAAALGIVDYTSRLGADVLKTSYLKDANESKIYFGLVWGLVLIGCVVLLSGLTQPLVLLVIAAVTGGLMMFMYSALLIMVNRRMLPAEIRPGAGRVAALVWSFLLFGFLTRADLQPADPEPVRRLTFTDTRSSGGAGSSSGICRTAATARLRRVGRFVGGCRSGAERRDGRTDRGDDQHPDDDQQQVPAVRRAAGTTGSTRPLRRRGRRAARRASAARLTAAPTTMAGRGRRRQHPRRQPAQADPDRRDHQVVQQCAADEPGQPRGPAAHVARGEQPVDAVQHSGEPRQHEQPPPPRGASPTWPGVRDRRRTGRPAPATRRGRRYRGRPRRTDSYRRHLGDPLGLHDTRPVRRDQPHRVAVVGVAAAIR